MFSFVWCACNVTNLAITLGLGFYEFTIAATTDLNTWQELFRQTCSDSQLGFSVSSRLKTLRFACLLKDWSRVHRGLHMGFLVSYQSNTYRILLLFFITIDFLVSDLLKQPMLVARSGAALVSLLAVLVETVILVSLADCCHPNSYLLFLKKEQVGYAVVNCFKIGANYGLLLLGLANIATPSSHTFVFIGYLENCETRR
nr:hypothetical transcript [Hymenolepis microstoma]